MKNITNKTLISDICIKDDVISITPCSFPFEKHTQWIQTFSNELSQHKSFCIQNTEINADITLLSIEFEQSVFILNISDTVESIWISPTVCDQSMLNRALQGLKHAFCHKHVN